MPLFQGLTARRGTGEFFTGSYIVLRRGISLGGGGECKRGKRGEGRKSKEEHNAYNYGKRKFSKSL